MNTQEKRARVKQLVTNMLNESHEAMLKKIDKALNSGAIDIDLWNEKDNPMILPKCIVTAVLQNESTQYLATGTSFEKLVKAEAKNIQYFL